MVPEEARCLQEQDALTTRPGSPVLPDRKTDRQKRPYNVLKTWENQARDQRQRILHEDGSPDSVGIQASVHLPMINKQTKKALK